MLTSGSSAPDYTCPAEAATVAVRLELEVPVVDVNSACTSLFAQIWMLSLMRPEALPPYVVIVAPEQLTKTVDYSDRAASVLWGDGAAAAVISLTEPGRAEIPTSRLVSSPAGWDRVIVPRQGHFDQDGRKVQMFAIRKTCESVNALKFEEPERRFHFIGHQANLRMLENVCRRCEIEPDRHHYNVDWYGNTAAASAASVVSMNWDKWGPRDDIAMAGVGGGLTWSSYLIRFGERAGGAA
jgi:3-oxoacyl-[acyl-carrier-protein] synthase-3